MWEVIEHFENPSRYGDRSESYPTLRRKAVPGGWLYESRTYNKMMDHFGGYLYIVYHVGLSTAFVPESPAHIEKAIGEVTP